MTCDPSAPLDEGSKTLAPTDRVDPTVPGQVLAPLHALAERLGAEELGSAFSRSAPDTAAVKAGKDVLEELAYEWGRQAVVVDPDWPDRDPSVTHSGEDQEHQGYAAGLRDAATELLQTIGRGRPCSKCRNPIIDPANAPDSDFELCRGCGEPG